MMANKIILPETFTVQIKDSDGNNIELDNILCHLNVHSNEFEGYNTFSFIPTGTDGKVVLTRDKIIQNTELKHSYVSSQPLDNRPVRFDFLIMDHKMLLGLILSIDYTLAVNDDSIQEDLRRRGLSEVQIEQAMVTINRKKIEDAKLNEFLKGNKNHLLDFNSEKSKISGEWTEEKDYFFDLIVQR